MLTTIKKPMHKVRGVFIQGGKILIVPSTRMKGFWVLPGGHVEKGEEPLNALARELKEELNIEVGGTDLVWLGNFVLKAPKNKGKIIMDVFLVQDWQGVIKPTGDITTVKWVNLNELENMKLGSGIGRLVVPALREKGLF